MKMYTIPMIEKLSDRQLRNLAGKPDRRVVKVYYPETEIAYPPIRGQTKMVEKIEFLHQHVRNEQFRRWQDR